MKLWQPIMDTASLPKPGTEESEMLDFKREPWGSTDSEKNELLRDIVQFANHLGGSIIVGADEEENKLRGFIGVSEPTKLVERIASLSHDRLSPRPRVDALNLKVEGTDIVVANINPSINPVALRLPGDSLRYEFYRRYGKSKRPMTFEEVEGMWTDGRRGKLLIVKIPELERNNVYLDVKTFDFSWIRRPASIQLLDDHFLVQLGGMGTCFNFPYEFIRAVWRRAGGGWSVSVSVQLWYDEGSQQIVARHLT